MSRPFDKLLVLDLDETLIHSTDLHDREGHKNREPDLQWGPFVTFWRPGVREFMDWFFENFEAVGIWTAGTLPYAYEIVPSICDTNRLAFLYGRERCTHHRNMETYQETYIKDIRKLRKQGFDRSKIICVDDSPEKFSRSYGNYVYMRPFEGDPADRELERLRRYLEELGSAPNVRTIEKRGWHASYDLATL
jgi:RNA polymerase II subunit A small phosphatase-like protein